MEQMGKYQLIRKLATGGMAEVFLARAAGPAGFEKLLVVKRILPHLVEDPQFTEMFLAEARLAALLNHAHVAQIFDFGEQEGMYFIAMEYIDGPNLRTLCRKAFEQQSPPPFPVCAKIISMACEGLAYAHELVEPHTGQPLRLIHRDISADNILLSRTGVAKVVDFGIAKAANTGLRTQTGIVKGKVAYMPPEQLLGRPLDVRADIYALGVVLYELVTGTRPYHADSEVSLLQAILNEPMIEVRALRAEVPAELERILNKALSKDREARHQSCRELQADLERFLLHQGEPVGAFQIADMIRQLVPPAQEVLPAVPVPGSGPRSGPAPAANTSPGSMEMPSTLELPAPVTAPTAPASETRTAVVPPPVPTAPIAPPAASPPAPARAGRSWAWVVPAAVLLLAAAGYALWSAGKASAPAPQPAPAAMATPAAPPAAEPAEPQQPAQAAAPATPPPPEQAPATTDSEGAESNTGAQEPEAQAKAPEEAAPSAAPQEPPAAAPRAQARLRVECNLPGQVYINGRLEGRAPAVVTVKPGRVRIAVSGSVDGNRFDKSQVLNVAQDEQREVELTIQKLQVRFRGSSDDLKVVGIDERTLNGEKEVETYEGRHKLKLIHEPTGRRYSSECELRPGDKLCKFFVELAE